MPSLSERIIEKARLQREAQGSQPQGISPQGPEPPAGIAPPQARAMPGAVPMPAPDSQPRGGEPQGAEPRGAEPPVEWKSGYLRLPNWLVFNFFSRLRIDERAVYEELYLWTHGFGENPRAVSQLKVAARLGIDPKQLRRIVRRLEEKGYVVKIESKLDGANSDRGTLFDVRLPDVAGAPAQGTPPQGEEPRGRTPRGREPHMKENTKENHESPSVYEIRTIAARLFEAHRGERGFSQERLRQLVRDALIGQGTQPVDGAIDDAIRGMVGS